jgi:hypothetical protein
MSKRIAASEPNKYGNEYDQIATAGMDVMDAACNTAHSYPGGTAALALRMGVNPNTLAHKVDPSKGTHVLGLKEALMMQKFSGDKRITHAMCAALGGVFIEIDSNDSGSSLAQVSKMITEFGESINEMQKAASDGVVTPNEMAKCEKEASELLASVNNALRSLRSMMPKRDSE